MTNTSELVPFIEISTVTSKLLRKGAYKDSFPEYYQLATVTENSVWHAHQNVLDHVIGVFSGLETVVEFSEFDDESKKQLHNYLAATIGNQTRLNILKIAALLHDIAKTDVLVTRPDGTASCPGHELIGAARVKNFSVRFNLDATAESYVERIVRYHGFISEILNLILANGAIEKYQTIFAETVGDVSIELILLMHADLLGCDLEKGDKSGYVKRIEILHSMLQQHVNGLH